MHLQVGAEHLIRYTSEFRFALKIAIRNYNEINVVMARMQTSFQQSWTISGFKKEANRGVALGLIIFLSSHMFQKEY